MVINGIWQNHAITISDKANCLTISRSAGGLPAVFSFDQTGRLWTAMVDGISYRRGLNGKIVAKWISPDHSHHRRWLLPAETIQLQEQARCGALELSGALADPSARFDAALSPQALQVLLLAGQFSTERYASDVTAYAQVYQPVGILPPDQYMAVVVQATLGCSFNTCTFCNFYRDRPFRIQDPLTFRSHVNAVKEFLGDGLSLRRTIFLGDANALVIPMPRLLALVDVLHDTLDIPKLGGLFAFLDGFSGERKSAADYARLSQQGFKRIYIGMESGHPALLQFLKKPGQPADVLKAVQTIKAGGISVGIIILLGAGGQQFARKHVEDTIRLINAMPLDADDLIYFSELVESEGMEYTRDAFQAALRPLSAAQRLAQGDEIEAGLRFSPTGGTPHISRYDIREFVY